MPAYQDKDLYGLGFAGMNVGAPGPNTGGLTARAVPSQPSFGPPAGPKPPNKYPTNGAQQPTVNLPQINVVGSNTSVGVLEKKDTKTTTSATDLSLKALPSNAIGSYVQEQFSRMRNDRTQIDALLLKCLYARKGEYTPEEIGLITGGGANTPGSLSALIETYFPITGTKCRAGEAWISDIFAGTQGRLWTIKPTSIPNVPDFVKDMVVQQIKEEMKLLAPLQEDDLRKRIKELRDIAMLHIQAAAAQATQRMTDKIQDQLDECQFDAITDDFVSDVLTFPYAVLKGPVVKNQQKLEWVRDKPKVKTTASLCAERVSPFDYYWSQYATSPQEGNNIELMHMVRSALHNCIGLKHFNESAIREVLDAYPTGFKVHTQITTQRQQLERNTYSHINDNELIDVMDFWGSLPGYLLKEWGVSEIKDEQASYEVNAWVVNGCCIRCLMNPDPLKARPYYVTSYEKVPGSLIGRSVCMLMDSSQEIINSAYRALRRNMGLASGPFCEADISRIAGGVAPNEIRPAMIKPVEPSLSGQDTPAYRFHDMNSHAQELENVIVEEIKKADDITGIPAYSYGNAAVSGAGRTVGGLAMLMGNASKGIKKVIGNIEQDVFNPMITSFYNYNMLFDDDPSLKVDAQVIASGPTGVILKEAQVQRRMEALQILGPFIPTGIIPKDGVSSLLRQILEGLDLDVDRIIPDPEQQKKLQQAAQGQQQSDVLPPGAEQMGSGAPAGIMSAGPGGATQQAPSGPGSPAGGPPLPPGMPPGALPNLPPPSMPGMPPGIPPEIMARMGPPPPGGGTIPQVMPDRRSGSAGPVAAMLNRGRM